MTTRLPYPSYRQTDLPWLGQIPAHWEAKRLKFVAPASTVKLTDKPVDLPYVGLENIESGTGKLLMDTQPETVESNVLIFERGDVLFGKLRPYLAKVAEPDFKGSCTTEILALRPRDVYHRYLFYSLLSPRFIESVNSMTYGTKMPRASWEQIGNMPISIPSLAEQQAIAAYLDRQTAKIDALIAKKQRLLDLFAEKRAAIISRAARKGLNLDVERKDSGVAWLGQIPGHWEVKRVAYLFRERDERNQAELPLLNVSIHTGVSIREFSNQHVEQMAADFSVYKVAYRGDIAFNKMRMWQGAVGRVPIDGLVSPDYVVASPIANIDTTYYGYLFKTAAFSAETARYSHGIVWDRLRLYWEEFRSIYVPIPPIDEQHQIVTYISQKTQVLADLATKVEAAIEHLQEYRAALISSVVTGKVDVRRYSSTAEGN
jgi:type I restriction enzyme S subunit